MKIFTQIIVLLLTFNLNAQGNIKKMLWNNIDKIAVPYANINQNGYESISNENGVININPKGGSIEISNVAYELKIVEQNHFHSSDTIFMQPKIFSLDEVVVKNDNRYTNIFNNVATEYASEPHIERFFIRAIIRKNNQLYKVADLSGVVEKQVLFGTTLKEMPKKNYVINIENIRKVGMEFKEYDFEFFSFKAFLNYSVSGYLSPKKYKFTYHDTENSNVFRIDALPKDSTETKTKGHYYVNSADNTFYETYNVNHNENSDFSQIRNIKYRTTFFENKSNFKRNVITNKYQLHQTVMRLKTVVFNKDVKDVFDVIYVYTAIPEISIKKVENNINIDKDMFDLNSNYNEKYWRNNEILPLTDEIQNFINKVNTKVDKPNFRTINNIK